VHEFTIRRENVLTTVFRYLMMQALAELAVMYPINGAFTMYICRFIDPSWGFACGWQYGIGWLTVLPFEISAACNVSTSINALALDVR
jgi:amino acid transporter